MDGGNASVPQQSQPLRCAALPGEGGMWWCVILRCSLCTHSHTLHGAPGPRQWEIYAIPWHQSLVLTEGPEGNNVTTVKINQYLSCMGLQTSKISGKKMMWGPTRIYIFCIISEKRHYKYNLPLLKKIIHEQFSWQQGYFNNLEGCCLRIKNSPYIEKVTMHSLFYSFNNTEKFHLGEVFWNH